MSTQLNLSNFELLGHNDFAFYKLTPEEISNPYIVLEDFFMIGNLPEIREKLWEFFKVTITGTYPQKLDEEEKTQINCLYEYLEKLVEAVHLVNELRLIQHLTNAQNIPTN